MAAPFPPIETTGKWLSPRTGTAVSTFSYGSTLYTGAEFTIDGSMTERDCAIKAAKMAGAFLKLNFYEEKKVDESLAHDIKLELDVKTQDMIEEFFAKEFPNYAFLGEEGVTGAKDSPNQWIVDPIDGTVNYFYGIPHFCVSIALRKSGDITLGVIYDPMMDELWVVEKGQQATLNDRPIRCSDRRELSESIVFVGHGSTSNSMKTGIDRFARVAREVRKMRMTGSAALALAYVACGRYDAYVEGRISLWDIAAGQLLVEAGGGDVKLLAHPTNPEKLQIRATNGKIPVEIFGMG